MSAWSKRTGALVVVACAGLGCGDQTGAAPPPTRPPAGGSLPPGVVARVGTLEITGDTVGRIAAAQHISPAAARDLAIRDALLASEARASGLDSTPEVAFGASSLLARRLLREVLAEAERAGPITDDELRATTARHWLELDRPEGFQTVHAVVRLDAKADAAKRKRATEIAEAIRRELGPVQALAARVPSPRGATPPKEDEVVEAFRKAAGAVPHEGLEVTIEALPPVAADGRTLTSEPGTFDVAFSDAAAKLGARGEISPPVTSGFGVHVLMLLDRIPGQVVPEAERRTMLRDEILTERARAAHKQLLERFHRDIALDRNVDALLALVVVDR